MSTRLLALGASAAILLAACGGGATTAPTTAPTGTAAAPTTGTPAPSAAAFKACLVTDTGGLGDKGFNDNALKGLQDALARVTRPWSRTSSPRRTRTTPATSMRSLPMTASRSPRSASTWATRPRPARSPTRRSPFRSSTTRIPRRSPTSPASSSRPQEAGMLAGYVAAGVLGDRQDRDLRRPADPARDRLHGRASGRHQVLQPGEWQERHAPRLQPGQQDRWRAGSRGQPLGQHRLRQHQANAFFQEGVDIVVPIAGGTGIGSFTAAKQAQAAGRRVYAIGVDTDQYPPALPASRASS